MAFSLSTRGGGDDWSLVYRLAEVRSGGGGRLAFSLLTRGGWERREKNDGESFAKLRTTHSLQNCLRLVRLVTITAYRLDLPATMRIHVFHVSLLDRYTPPVGGSTCASTDDRQGQREVRSRKNARFELTLPEAVLSRSAVGKTKKFPSINRPNHTSRAPIATFRPIAAHLSRVASLPPHRYKLNSSITSPLSTSNSNREVTKTTSIL